jgi:hypothetical protein
MTHRLVSAIAESLWRPHGGNYPLNWLDAARHLHRIANLRPRKPKSAERPREPVPGCRVVGVSSPAASGKLRNFAGMPRARINERSMM